MPVTTPTLTVAVQADGRTVKVTVSDYGSATEWTARRLVDGVDPGTGPWIIRGAHRRSVSSPNVYDTDYPQNSDVTYVVSVSDGTTTLESAESAVVNIDLGGDVLVPMATAPTGYYTAVTQVDELAHDRRVEVVSVIERPDPVVVAGTPALPSFTLGLFCDGATAVANVRATLEAGPVFLLSLRDPSRLSSQVAMYLAPSNVRETLVGNAGGARLFTMDVQQVGAPRTPAVTSYTPGWPT